MRLVSPTGSVVSVDDEMAQYLGWETLGGEPVSTAPQATVEGQSPADEAPEEEPKSKPRRKTSRTRTGEQVAKDGW